MAEMSDAMRAFVERAARNALEMQVCDDCGAVAWPPREGCAACWSAGLAWRAVAPTGVVIAETRLHVSFEEFFRSRLPWRVGTIKLDAGAAAYAHLHAGVREGDKTLIEAHLDYRGRGVLIALPPGGSVADDARLRDLVSQREE